MNAGRIWTVRESATTWLQDFPSAIVPGELASQVRVVTRGGQSGLEVGGIIGAVALLNGDTLQIVPKVGQANFFRMLLTAEGLLDRIPNADQQFVSWGADDDPGAAAAILARRLLLVVAQIEAGGPRFARVRVTQHKESPSGRVLPGPSIKRLRLRSMQPFECVTQVRTFDVPENRVIAAALRTAIQYLKVHEDWQLALATRWQREFYRPGSLQPDLAVTAERLGRGFYGGPRGTYASGLTLARLILGQAGISLQGEARVLGDSLFVNSATLFENYVRAVLAGAMRQLGYSVSKGGAPAQFMYDDGSFELIPDIRVSQGLSTIALGDAKYKVPDASDHYQMAAYMRAYNVSRAFLLCPEYAPGLDAITRHRASDGRTVAVVRLPLTDLDVTEQLLADLHRIVPFRA